MLRKIGKALKKTWEYLDGKKTYVGLALMAGSKFCGEYEQIVYLTGSVLAGVGAGDKVRKKIRSKNNGS